MTVERPESSGISPADFVEQDRPEGGYVRPLSLAWIDDELLEETIRVWSKFLGRPVHDEEAIEMLLNVKQVAVVLMKEDEEA